MRWRRLMLLMGMACASPPAPSSLESVRPHQLPKMGGVVTIRGTGFLPGGTFDFDRPKDSLWSYECSASLTGQGAIVALREVNWIDSQTVVATVPSNTTAGLYSLSFRTPRGEELSLAQALTIVEGTVTPEDDGGLPCEIETWADSDGDGFGAPGTQARVCGPGRVQNSRDCHDGDALANPAATEVCNGIDDNCDGRTDEGACAGDGGLALTPLRSLERPGRSLVAVSSFGPHSAWVASATELFLIQSDGGFSAESSNCPTGMNRLWADPTGRVFVAGGNRGVGRLATARRGQGCTPSVQLPDPVAGLVGFHTNDGGVIVEALLLDGRRATWDGVSPPNIRGARANERELAGAHGVSPEILLGVGRVDRGPPVAVRSRADGGVSDDDLSAVQLSIARLETVWATSSDDGVAGGPSGTILERTANGWSRIQAPFSNDVVAVRAFARGRFFAATKIGTVWRFSGNSKQIVLNTQRPMNALAVWDETHLWLVGDNGVLFFGSYP